MKELFTRVREEDLTPDRRILLREARERYARRVEDEARTRNARRIAAEMEIARAEHLAALWGEWGPRIAMVGMLIFLVAYAALCAGPR